MAWLPTFTYTDVFNNWDALLYQKGEVSQIITLPVLHEVPDQRDYWWWMCSGNVMVIHLLGKFISCPKWQGFILWGAWMNSMHSYWYVYRTISTSLKFLLAAAWLLESNYLESQDDFKGKRWPERNAKQKSKRTDAVHHLFIVYV